MSNGWRFIASAPRGVECLFFAKGNPSAGNENARYDHMQLDEISDRWPHGRYQYPEAPYTSWHTLPEPPL